MIFGIISFVSDVADLCKGSTNDSDSFCPGSNPGSAAIKIYRINALKSSIYAVFYLPSKKFVKS